VYTTIGTAEGKTWHQSRLFQNPNKHANWTVECTGDDLNLLTRQHIPNDNISVVA
jgi:hypothetical protein